MTEIVTDYKLLEGTPTELNQLVNEYLRNGWKLKGEPFLRKTVHDYEVIVQCMVKSPVRSNTLYG